METSEGDRLDLDLSVKWDIESIEELSVSSTEVVNVTAMVFIVKKPDYLGESKWELRHGDRSISAKIEDLDWLRSFQSRKVDIRPRDAIKCAVRIEMLYGIDNELVSEHHFIEKVIEVVPSYYQNTITFD